ncbi:MAG: endonuclease [Planctomycetes bacterium]|nr:endonuclease [Planctomycetota bacterium]
MSAGELRKLLEASLEDARLSRSERHDLREALASHAGDQAALARIESEVFELATKNGAAGEIMTWLRQVSSLLRTLETERLAPPDQRLYFSPRDDCPQLIRSLIRSARREIRVCVFTITDDRIADELLEAQRRGIDLRIVSDDDKAEDLGSDLDRLAGAGVPIALDRDGHMHHKFAVFDQRSSISGSYNWTRGAAQDNHESILLSNDAGLARGFLDEFDRLWQRYA